MVFVLFCLCVGGVSFCISGWPQTYFVAEKLDSDSPASAAQVPGLQVPTPHQVHVLLGMEPRALHKPEKHSPN